IAAEPADGRWRLTRPRALPADSDTIRDFLDKLRGARVKEFVAEAPPSRAPFGPAPPVRVAINTGRDKDRATKTLLFGRADTAKKGVYAMRAGESAVMLIPDEAWTAVPKNVAVLRDKAVVEVDREKVTKIEIESPKGAVTLAQENGRWRITAPEALAGRAAGPPAPPPPPAGGRGGAGRRCGDRVRGRGGPGTGGARRRQG